MHVFRTKNFHWIHAGTTWQIHPNNFNWLYVRANRQLQLYARTFEQQRPFLNLECSVFLFVFFFCFWLFLCGYALYESRFCTHDEADKEKFSELHRIHLPTSFLQRPIHQYGFQVPYQTFLKKLSSSIHSCTATSVYFSGKISWGTCFAAFPYL